MSVSFSRSCRAFNSACVYLGALLFSLFPWPSHAAMWQMLGNPDDKLVTIAAAQTADGR